MNVAPRTVSPETYLPLKVKVFCVPRSEWMRGTTVWELISFSPKVSHTVLFLNFAHSHMNFMEQLRLYNHYEREK